MSVRDFGVVAIYSLFLFMACQTTQLVKIDQGKPPQVSPLTWDHADWDAKINPVIADNLAVFSADQAGAVKFCAKYASLSRERQIQVWGEMVVGIVRYESDFNPHSIYHEPPPLGVDSIGLLQLSYEDKAGYPSCNLNRATKNLEDPVNNLDCGLKIMLKLIDKDGVITGGGQGAWKGLARYWSTMRPAPKGKLEKIQELVQSLPFCK